MSREENLKILQLLQEGKITADEASQLLAAIDKPTPAPAPQPEPAPAPAPSTEDDTFETETLARARAKIAAAREKVAGYDQQLAAAEEKLEEAKKSPNPIASLNEALRGLPGSKSLSGAFRDFDPGRFAATAKKQAKRLSKQVTSSIGNIDFDLNHLSQTLQGDPTYSQNYELSFELEAGTLRIKNPLGGITVQGTDVPGVRVAGELQVWAATIEEAKLVAEGVQVISETSESGGTVSVTVGPKARRQELELTLFVPSSGVNVSLLSPSGDLSIRGLKSAAVLATQSGDIHVAELVGDVAAETTSGDIALEGVIGAVSAHTASGNLTAIRLDGATFKAEAQSGDISLSEAMVPTVQLAGVSGDTTVRNVTGKTLNLRTVSGDAQVIGSEFDTETHLDTVSGNLTLSPKGALTSGKLILSSVSGDTLLTLPAKTNAVLEGRTRSGELKGKIKGADGQVRNINGSGMVIVSESIGEGTGAAIVLSSVSGDLHIEQE